MRIKFLKLSLQNFYSYGDKQTIDFTQFKSPVVLIDGIDLDTEGSKIGSGKSTIFAGITYALFGETVSNIKANEIVNYIKGKKALVELEFKIKNQIYKIERGRKPKVLKLLKYDDGDWIDLSKSEDKETDKLIQSLIKINFETFLQTTLFSVSSEANKPFLNLTPSNQKRILENIFNFEAYKIMIDRMKEIKKEYEKEYAVLEKQIQTMEYSNKRIEEQIERLEESVNNFDIEKERKIKKLKEEIEKYETEIKEVNINEEKIEVINELEKMKSEIKNEINELRYEMLNIEKELNEVFIEKEKIEDKINKLKKEKKSLENSICPVCGQEWKDDEYYEEIVKKINKLERKIIKYDEVIDEIKVIYKKIKKRKKSKEKTYSEINEEINKILNNKSISYYEKLLTLIEINKEKLVELEQMENYYIDELENAKKMLVEIDYTDLNRIDSKLKKIKAFIALADDSKMRGKFLRRFIKQLNVILKQFKKLIPDYNIHIQFNPDFTIRLMRFGKEISAGSLSNGEKRIGNIMIMMALMKIFKMKNNVEFDAMFLDEVLDSGINGVLLESVFKFIRNIAKEEKMRIFLISHREEIKEKILEVIFVEKSRGISKIKILK